MVTTGNEAKVINLICERRSTLQKEITFYSNDVLTNWTGYTAKMQVKKSIDFNDTPILNLTTENGGLTLGGANGTILIYIAASATDEIEPNIYFYDLKVYISDKEYKKIKGQFEIKAGVTND